MSRPRKPAARHRRPRPAADPAQAPSDGAPPRPTKREATRRRLLDRALRLLRERGVDGTTMRDIADAAGLSLGAAYYHFPSKEALLFAYYAENQAAAEALMRAYPPGEPLRARLGRLIHDRLRTVAPYRTMLGAIVPRLANPADPVSAFSAESAEVRARAIGNFDAILDGEGLPAPTRRLIAAALWLFHLGLLLLFVYDDTPGQARTHRLADDLLEVVAPLIALAGTPFAQPLVDRVVRALDRAGLAIA